MDAYNQGGLTHHPGDDPSEDTFEVHSGSLDLMCRHFTEPVM
jgi:hypothetical protein